MQPIDLHEKDKLSRCPFCQGKAFLYFNEVGQRYFAGCVNELKRCNVISSTRGADTAEQAIAFWNDRKTIIMN